MGRADPEITGERDLLAASLDAARHAVVSRLVGVPVVLLHEPLVSPDSSLLGVIKHLTLLERRWFAHTFAGLDVALGDTDDHRHVGWRLERSDTARTVVAQYRAECQRSREIVERAGVGRSGVPAGAERAPGRAAVGVAAHDRADQPPC